MKILLVICCHLTWIVPAIAQESLLKELDYGKYEVGFEVIKTKDHSRTFYNNETKGYDSRPIEMGIWYPAKIDENDSNASFNSFPYFSNLNQSIFKFKSVINAEKLEGEFPLIIYATSQGSSGYDNATLCEQIASFGYIVITTESKGQYSRNMPFNHSGVYSQYRDLEFLYGFMQDYTGVNSSEIGTVGFSLGGLSMVAFSSINKKVKAMVSLDGSIEPGLPILESFSFIKINEFKSDMLAFLGDKSTISNFPLIEKTSLSELELLKLKDLIHTDFSSTNLLYSSRPENISNAYVNISNLTIQYLNMKFYNDVKFEQSINSYSKEIYTEHKFRQAAKEPSIGKDEFISYISENGIDEGVALYYNVKTNFPEYNLFEYSPFRDIGYLLMQKKEYSNAVSVFRVLIDAYPENPDSYRRLGEALMMAGEYEESEFYLTKGLEIDPQSPAMQDILRRLNEKKNQ